MKTLGILALQNIPGIGDKALKNILSSSSNADPASPRDLYEIIKESKFKFDKIPSPDISMIENGWAKAVEILDKSMENDIKIIGKDSPYYPSLLLDIDNPPELLHIKGNISILNENSIAIVGTRKPTEYGICQATDISEKFAERNNVIVSGLAKGIDTAAHKGALNVKGKTIAVLAHGLDTIYPKENKKLAERILDNNGLLVSEYFWGKRSTKGSFITRDRIQSGLSLSVLVVETKDKGGTMHTVNYCREQGKPLIVLEMPKHLNYVEYYTGNINLIKDKMADFVLKCEDKSYVFEVKISNNNLKTYTKNFIKHGPNTEIDVNRHRIQEFSNYLYKFFISYDLECSKVNDKSSIKENNILQKCQSCKNFNKCKLAEEGFVDLCPFDGEDERLSMYYKLYQFP